jgi:Zn-dependent peptidase ImmA (M78 family)/DNA-binding XRE family transcriptional regulator
MNNETLKLARNYLGLSQSGFAKRIGVSQALISGIEKSNKPLTQEIIEKLKNEFSSSFFSQRMYTPNLKVHYRSSANIAKKYTDLFESRLHILANNISELLEYVNIPGNNIPKKDLEEFKLNPEYLANEIRSYFELGLSPIKEIVPLLEKNGVIIHFFDYDFISSQNKNFDGVSFYVSGVPVILINKKIQNARKVFTIAHELGHLIMHNHNDFIISNDRDLEKEANVFASEFIAPKLALRGEFSRLTLEKLFDLKAYWKISIGALLYKASIMSLTKDQYRRWITKLAPFRKEEPRDFYLESPVLLNKMIEVCKNEVGSDQELLEILGLSESLYEEIYSTIIRKTRTKLRIVL